MRSLPGRAVPGIRSPLPVVKMATGLREADCRALRLKYRLRSFAGRYIQHESERDLCTIAA